MIGHPNLQFHITGQDYNDHSKNSFTGTNTGVDIVAGVIGNGLSVNALTDSVNYGDQAALNFERTSLFSIAFWLKGTIPTARANIFGKTAAPTPKGWWITNSGSADGNGMVELFLISSWGSNWFLARGGQMSTNWQHFCFTYSGNSNRSGVVLYVNGAPITLDATTPNALSASITTAAAVVVGTSLTSQATMSSTIDDIQIYNCVLPQSGVRRVMMGKHPLFRS